MLAARWAREFSGHALAHPDPPLAQPLEKLKFLLINIGWNYEFVFLYFLE